MKADHDDPVVTPVAMPRNPQKSTYRDPSVFRSVAIIRPAIHSPLAITFIDGNIKYFTQTNVFLRVYLPLRYAKPPHVYRLGFSVGIPSHLPRRHLIDKYHI